MRKDQFVLLSSNIVPIGTKF